MNDVLRALATIIVWALGVGAGWLFYKYRDPLKRIKDLSSNPIVGIFAGTFVTLAEMWHSDLGGEEQFREACGLLANTLGVEPADVEELVQKAYEAMKELLAEEWGALRVRGPALREKLAQSVKA